MTNDSKKPNAASGLANEDRLGREVAWDVSHDLHVIVDLRGWVRDVNPAWQGKLGFAASSVIGKHLPMLAHPEDAGTVEAAIAGLDKDGSNAEFECRIAASDNSYRLISWSATRVRNHIACAGRDITAERQRQIALDDSRDFARLALSAVSGVGVWTYEVSSDCFFCDAAVSELYGINAEQAAKGIRREYFLANVHPDDRAALRNTMSGGLLHSGDLELEYRICHPDGSVRHVLSRGHTYFNEQGLPVRRTGVGVDMTSQRELEQQLRQSQKMEAVGHLTGGLAHDFNNMLQGVIGPLELVRHLVARGKTEQLDRFLGMAISSAHRAASLTHRLLAFSRKQPLAPRSADVRELIPSIEDLIRQTANKDIEIAFDMAAQPCHIRCDTNQLESALLNPSINACDAMPRGGVLRIAASVIEVGEAEAAANEGASPGAYVRIAVSDTGSGMPQEVLKQALEPFFTTKPLGRGTGLGLSMVYGFVRQSGGFVTIESALGQGTTVALFMPEAVVADEAPRQPKALAAGPAGGAGETVLIVDDDETIRQLLVELFGLSGYTSIQAHDGPSGLAVLKSDVKIDLLVSDVRLPGLNGKQMADAARVGRPMLPVLFITGYAEEAVSDGFLDDNMAMLTKPFSIEAVLAQASELLRRA